MREEPPSTGGRSAEDNRLLELLHAARVVPPDLEALLRGDGIRKEAQFYLPFKTLSLRPEPRHRYSSAAFGLRADPAEMYHEQSKLHSGTGALASILAREQEQMSVHLLAAYNGLAICLPPGDGPNGYYDRPTAFAASVASLCAETAGQPRLLFAADIFLLLPRGEAWGLYRYLVADDRLHLIRMAPRAQVAALASDLPEEAAWLPANPGREETGLPMAVFVVGALGRMFMVAEERGYRAMALQAGQLAGLVKSWARRQGLETEEHFHFHDDAWNRFLGLEGLTKSLMSILILRVPAEEAPL